MIINITIPDDFVPKVLENLPEYAADSFRCSRWDYENCTFDLTDIETNQNYTLTRAMAEDGFRKLLQEMADDIDDLCERINCAAPPKVLAIVRGGVCQGARSTVEGIEFHVRDYDNEEQKEENFPEGGPSKEEVFDRLEKEDEEAYPHVIY